MVDLLIEKCDADPKVEDVKGRIHEYIRLKCSSDTAYIPLLIYLLTLAYIPLLIYLPTLAYIPLLMYLLIPPYFPLLIKCPLSVSSVYNCFRSSANSFSCFRYSEFSGRPQDLIYIAKCGKLQLVVFAVLKNNSFTFVLSSFSFSFGSQIIIMFLLLSVSASWKTFLITFSNTAWLIVFSSMQLFWTTTFLNCRLHGSFCRQFQQILVISIKKISLWIIWSKNVFSLPPWILSLSTPKTFHWTFLSKAMASGVKNHLF